MSKKAATLTDEQHIELLKKEIDRLKDEKAELQREVWRKDSESQAWQATAKAAGHYIVEHTRPGRDELPF